MSKLSVSEVSDLLLSREDSYGEQFTWYSWDYETHDEVVPGLGRVEVIENVGGEGQGEHAHLVFRVTDEGGNTRHFKLDGYYASYDGTTWDGDLHEVTPVQKTITVYE